MSLALKDSIQLGITLITNQRSSIRKYLCNPQNPDSSFFMTFPPDRRLREVV